VCRATIETTCMRFADSATRCKRRALSPIANQAEDIQLPSFSECTAGRSETGYKGPCGHAVVMPVLAFYGRHEARPVGAFTGPTGVDLVPKSLMLRTRSRACSESVTGNCPRPCANCTILLILARRGTCARRRSCCDALKISNGRQGAHRSRKGARAHEAYATASAAAEHWHARTSLRPRAPRGRC